MIRFFKSPQPAALIIVPFIVLILWGQSAFHLQIAGDEPSMPLWKLLSGLFSQLPSFVNFILFSGLISLEAIYLNLLLNKHEVLYKNSYLPSLCFALVSSASGALLMVHPVHLINLILLKVFDNMFSLFKNEAPVRALFDSGFLMALAALLYFPAISGFLLLLLAISLLRPFNIREWLVMLIGYGLPLFFVSVVAFWNEQLLVYWKNYFDNFRQIRPQWNIVMTTKLQVLAGVMSAFLMMAVLKLRSNYFKNIIRTRTYQQMLFFFLLVSGASILMVNHIAMIHFVSLAIPVAVFYAYYFVAAKKRLWMAEGILWILIFTVLWNHL